MKTLAFLALLGALSGTEVMAVPAVARDFDANAIERRDPRAPSVMPNGALHERSSSGGSNHMAVLNKRDHDPSPSPSPSPSPTSGNGGGNGNGEGNGNAYAYGQGEHNGNQATPSPSPSPSPSSTSSAAPQPTGPPSGWRAASTPCIAEGTSGRALSGASKWAEDMTYQQCASFCASGGFSLAGLEYSRECYCGNYLDHGASLSRSASNCDMHASGNPNQIAGGSWAMTLLVADQFDETKVDSEYKQKQVQETLPSGWSALHDSGICIQEGSSGRALAGASTWAEDMTIGKCISFCSSKGMQYAGLEYSRECFCGNDLVNGASSSRTAPCDMQCAGSPGNICGGPWTLSVYQDASKEYTKTQVGNYKKQGCIQEVGGRAFTGASIAQDDMTIEKCIAFCGAGNFGFAGLEYSRECYCGNTLDHGASLEAFSTQCYMPCAGDVGSTCGGPNAISLWSTAEGLARVGA